MSGRRVGAIVSLCLACAVVVGWPASAAPDEGAFRQLSPLEEARWGHSATALPGSRVLVIGGEDPDRSEFLPPGYFTPEQLDGAELWDPSLDDGDGAFTAAGTLDEPRSGHTSTLLDDGRVLVVGGGKLNDRKLAELWDPETRTFSRAGYLQRSRRDHSATKLDDGRVLIVGGLDEDFHAIGPSELWDPVLEASESAAPLGTARSGHTATLLSDGRVLVVGGRSGARGPGLADDESPELASAEVWDPVSSSFEPAGTMPQPRAGHTATLLPDGRVLVIGGSSADAMLAGALLWDPADSAFHDAGSLIVARSGHTATLLPDVGVLVIGGWGDRSVLPSAEVWHPSDGRFRRAGSMHTARSGHTATADASGQVLVVGGSAPGGALASVEAWQPVR